LSKRKPAGVLGGQADRDKVPFVPIIIEGVTKTFGSVRAVVSASATFEDRKVTVIIGANGSGKTTLLHMIGGLARPTLGRIDLGEHGKTLDELRAHLGWVGHDTMCYADLSGLENVALAARLRGIDERTARDSAKTRFSLEAFGDRAVRFMSRGQRQRVALARALVHEPTLVLLDEPTTGLDKAGVDTLVEVVKRERERGATLIVVTHDAAFAERVADATFKMERGRLAPQK
jgi:ABC-type multidrug transport system ATPase subunit